MMELNDKPVTSEDEILAVLDAVASGEEEFAILAKSPKRFIQTSGNMLEYNSGQKLYSAEKISNEDIKAAFLDYYRGNDGYKKFFRKTSAKAKKESFSDIVRETWHDFLDICIFTTLRSHKTAFIAELHYPVGFFTASLFLPEYFCLRCTRRAIPILRHCGLAVEHFCF